MGLCPSCSGTRVGIRIRIFFVTVRRRETTATCARPIRGLHRSGNRVAVVRVTHRRRAYRSRGRRREREIDRRRGGTRQLVDRAHGRLRNPHPILLLHTCWWRLRNHHPDRRRRRLHHDPPAYAGVCVAWYAKCRADRTHTRMLVPASAYSVSNAPVSLVIVSASSSWRLTQITRVPIETVARGRLCDASREVDHGIHIGSGRCGRGKRATRNTNAPTPAISAIRKTIGVRPSIRTGNSPPLLPPIPYTAAIVPQIRELRPQ